ncbi:hypothetical protein AgCh_034975 [Apium graveolens]
MVDDFVIKTGREDKLAVKGNFEMKKRWQKLDLQLKSLADQLKDVDETDLNWKKVMNEDYKGLIKIGTWELVPRPKDANVIYCILILKSKTQADVNVHGAGQTQYQTLQEHKDEVWFLQFSHNGKHLASSSKDQTALLWECWSVLNIDIYSVGNICTSEDPSETILKQQGLQGAYGGQVYVVKWRGTEVAAKTIRSSIASNQMVRLTDFPMAHAQVPEYGPLAEKPSKKTTTKANDKKGKTVEMNKEEPLDPVAKKLRQQK